MPKSRLNLILLLCAALLTLFSTIKIAGMSFTSCPLESKKPKITIWAWERNEDLRFIDPKEVEVAYFAGNIYLQGERVRFRPRTHKLLLPRQTKTTPVFRIETIRASEPLSHSSADIVAEIISKQLSERSSAAGSSSIQQVQLDFDALEDERAYYRLLLERMRHRVPPKTKISITALTSWLMHDRWLSRGCADEAVAMLFSMGPGKGTVLERIEDTKLDTGAGLDIAIGISANEIETNKTLRSAGVLKSAGSIYIFNSRPWTERRFKAIKNEALET